MVDITQILEKINGMEIEDDHDMIFVSITKSYIFLEKNEQIDRKEVLIITISKIEKDENQYFTYIGKVKEIKDLSYEEVEKLTEQYYVDVFEENGFVMQYNRNVILGVPIVKYEKYIVLFMEDISTA